MADPRPPTYGRHPTSVKFRTMDPRPLSPHAWLSAVVAAAFLALSPASAQSPATQPPPATAPAPVAPRAPAADAASARPPDFNQMRRDQAATDRAWRTASDGVMR